MDDSEFGYVWLFVVYFLFLIRLCFDTVMVRRPLLEPNLMPEALSFSCFFLFLFVLAALTVNRGNKIDTIRTVRLEHILTTRHLAQKVGMNPATLTIPYKELPNIQPGFRPFLSFCEHASLSFTPPPQIRAEMLQYKTDFSSWRRFFLSVNDSLNHASSPTSINNNHISAADNPSTPVKTVIENNNPATITPPPTIPQLTMLSENNETINLSSTSTTLPPRPVLLSEPEADISATVSPVEQVIQPPSLGQFCLFMLIPILTQFMIVLGFIYVGHCHFGNIRTGVACATLYLLLPYTNQMVGRIDHIVPSAFILWGVAMYRRPFCAGICIGSAAALVFYPLCLIPLWGSFYWRKGWVRFLIGTSSAIVLFSILLLFSPSTLGSYSEQFLHMFGKSSLRVFSSADGFWNYHDIIYRVPLLACYFAVCFGMLLWPIHKHLAVLLSCSSIIMIGTQFWQLHQGGLYIAWFIPLLILTIFRPNLEDRVAQSTVI
jgi:hypothetical protein